MKREPSEDDRERFQEAKEEFIDSLAKSLGIYKILDWLSGKLAKVIRSINQDPSPRWFFSYGVINQTYNMDGLFGPAFLVAGEEVASWPN